MPPHDPRSLYSGAYRRLVGQAYALTGHVGRAEQAVTTAFVRAILARRRFGHADDPEGWLRRAALAGIYAGRRRAAVSRLLRRHPDPAPPYDGPAVPVIAALRRLPPAERDAIALAGIARLSAGEISEVSGQSARRAGQRIHRARAELDGDAALGGQPVLSALAVVRAEVEDSAERPPYEDVLVRARSVGLRRRLTATAAVVVLAGAGFAIREATRPTPLPVGQPITQVVFTDHGHGYAVGGACAAGCRLRVSATSDGGRSWRALAVPRTGRVSSAILSTSGAAVAMDFTEPGRPDQFHATTRDRGRRWRVVDTGQPGTGPPAQTIASVPKGWTLVTAIAGDGPIVVATDPISGESRRLAHQPPLTGLDVSPPYEPGGRIWVTGDKPDINDPFQQELAESDDAGRTWSVVTPPPLRPQEEVSVLYPAPDDGLFVQTRLPGELVRRTWRLDGLTPEVWTRLPDFHLGVEAVVSTVLPDSELWLTDSSYASWISSHLGHRPGPMRRPTIDGRRSRVAFAGRTPDGLVYGTPPPAGRKDIVFVSTDAGQHWATRVVDVSER